MSDTIKVMHPRTKERREVPKEIWSLTKNSNDNKWVEISKEYEEGEAIAAKKVKEDKVVVPVVKDDPLSAASVSQEHWTLQRKAVEESKDIDFLEELAELITSKKVIQIIKSRIDELQE